jgi:putative lipoic acid-binding regulatory protein
MADNENELIEFPCHFPIKVIGKMSEDFSNIVITIINQHVESFDATKIEMRGSSNGKYISLTCNVFVETKEQLDRIYIDLSGHPQTQFVI